MINNNPIIEYYDKIKSGEILACDSIKATYKHLSEKNGKPGLYEYDEKRAEHVIKFFEHHVKHSKGKWAGRPIKLELWEKALLSAAFGFVDENGFRQYQRVILIVAKKNGKSFISSGIGLYLLVADGEAGAEVYSVATTRDQAKIVWSEAKRMRNKSPALRKRLRTTINEIAYDEQDSIFKPLASNADTLDGLNVHGALLDEFHQWRNGMSLYNIIADGTSARDEPMIVLTSTAGFVREDIYDDIYAEAKKIINGYKDKDGYKDDRTLALIYELDDKKEWLNPKMWIKANPNLGVTKSKEALAEKVTRAKENPHQIKNVLTKEFNIPETRGQTWLDFETIDNRATFSLDDFKGSYAVLGVDLSKTTDLTSACLLFEKPNDPTIYAQSMFWMPYDFVEKRVKEDKVPYDKWITQGHLRTCDGNVINYKDIIEWLEELREKYEIYIAYVGYDAWSAQYFVDDLKLRYGEFCLEKINQGKRTLSSPMLSLGADLAAKKINYNNNPILKWNMTNVAIDADRNGNIQPIKSVNAKQRIDGFAALLDAYVARERHLDEYHNLIGD